MKNHLEDHLIRVARQMSPKRDSYPLDIKAWEDNLRSSIPKITYSDYYILNAPETPIKCNPKAAIQYFPQSDSQRHHSEPSRSCVSKSSYSPLKSDFMTTAASRTFQPSPSKPSEEEYNNRVKQLQIENQKFKDLYNEEIKRHTAEKVIYI